MLCHVLTQSIYLHLKFQFLYYTWLSTITKLNSTLMSPHFVQFLCHWTRCSLLSEDRKTEMQTLLFFFSLRKIMHACPTLQVHLKGSRELFNTLICNCLSSTNTEAETQHCNIYKELDNSNSSKSLLALNLPRSEK